MEPVMKRLTIIATLAVLAAAPVAAQSLSALLPALSFPQTVTTPSTKDCAPSPATVCPPQK
jgi:hypothetical protein